MTVHQGFATKLPPDLVRALDTICERFGLRKNFVVEQALREKLEDLVDAFELDEARSTSVSFTAWTEVRKALARRGRL